MDRFARIYSLSTVEESNEKGDYYNYNITALGFPPKPIYLKAEQLYNTIKEGAIIQADRTVEEETTDEF